MPRVLVSPAEYEISNEDYGKTYNLLDNLRGDGLSIEAHVGHCSTPLTASNVHVRELGGGNRLRYYSRAFRTTAREFDSGDVDVYHHMNLSYRWFNPLLLANKHGETPVVIGPCQAGHAIMDEEFNRMVSHTVGRDLSRTVTDPLHSVVNGIRDFALDPVRMSLFKRTLRAADRIVVVHEEAKSVYADLVDESKLRVVPLGVNPDQFEYSERNESNDLVAIGSLRKRKGYDILLEAIALVCERHPSIQLNVFGRGPQREELVAQVRRLGIEENVTFHGFVDQSVLKEHLASARAFVHPSRSESFSLVRLEAMASGCPVVVSDIDGAREMVRDGTDGFVVPRASPKPLAERLDELLADLGMAKEMGRSARERVEEKYDWRTIGRSYVDIYRSLL